MHAQVVDHHKRPKSSYCEGIFIFVINITRDDHILHVLVRTDQKWPGNSRTVPCQCKQSIHLVSVIHRRSLLSKSGEPLQTITSGERFGVAFVLDVQAIYQACLDAPDYSGFGRLNRNRALYKTAGAVFKCSLYSLLTDFLKPRLLVGSQNVWRFSRGSKASRRQIDCMCIFQGSEWTSIHKLA